MPRQSNRARRFRSTSEPTEARGALERRWRDRLDPQPGLATLVTAHGAAREPFHRWLPYRQGFSPGLVRLFLREERGTRDGIVIDPFSGSGTTVVECARQGQAAIGMEAMESLVFVTRAKFEPAWSTLPPLRDTSSWEAIAAQLTLPVHRAGLMIAHARRHTAEGKLNRGAPSMERALALVCEMMAEDLGHPLARAIEVRTGDARRLSGIENASMGGLLTSPPYLSRYDYVRSNEPLETVYRYWFSAEAEAAAESAPRRAQLRARPLRTARGKRLGVLPHGAAAEVQTVLEAAGRRGPASIIGTYFEDMGRVLDAALRVLRPEAPAWFVVGGSRIHDVYMPTDLIFAELAEQSGFHVEGIRVARDLIPVRRKFAGVGFISPRESVIALRRP